MSTFEELKTKLDAKIGEIETLEAKVAEIEASEDQSDLEVAQKAVQDAQSEYETLKGDCEQAMMLAAEKRQRNAFRDKLAAEAAQKTATVTAGKAPAEPKDHDFEEATKSDVVRRYLLSGWEGVSGQERDLVAPKSESFEAGREGACLPKSIVASIFGPQWCSKMGLDYATKVTPSTSATAGRGGNLVDRDFIKSMLELPQEQAYLLNRVRILPTSTGDVYIPRLQQTDSNEYGGMSGSWITEGATKEETQPTFEQVNIATHEYALSTAVTHRLLKRSAIAFEMWLKGELRSLLVDALETAIISGSGSGQPEGFLNATGIRSVARNTASDVKWQDLVNLKYSLKPYHRGSGIFVVEDDALKTLELDVDGDSRPLFTSSVANGIYDRLVGYPYIGTTRMSALGAAGDVAFIDPRYYYLVMEDDVVVKRDDSLGFRTNTAWFAAFLVAGGKMVEPRVCASLSASTS